MKRVLTGSFLAAAFAVGLSAQTTPPQTTPPSTPPSSPSAPAQSMQDRDKTVTVTGCLKAGSGADSFTLSDLKWGGSKGSGAVGTSGAAGGGAPAGLATATTLKVDAGSTKLSEHVGHQVEISGSISDSDKASPSAAAKPSDPAARPSASASGPTIEAKSVRMVSATCSGQ